MLFWDSDKSPPPSPTLPSSAPYRAVNTRAPLLTSALTVMITPWPQALLSLPGCIGARLPSTHGDCVCLNLLWWRRLTGTIIQNSTGVHMTFHSCILNLMHFSKLQESSDRQLHFLNLTSHTCVGTCPFSPCDPPLHLLPLSRSPQSTSCYLQGQSKAALL